MNNYKPNLNYDRESLNQYDPDNISPKCMVYIVQSIKYLFLIMFAIYVISINWNSIETQKYHT